MNESKWNMRDLLVGKNRPILCLTAIVVAFFTCVFFVGSKAAKGAYVTDDSSVTVLSLMFAAIIVPVGWYFGFRRRIRFDYLIFVLVVVVMAMYARVLFYDFPTTDTLGPLKAWVEHLASYPGIDGLKDVPLSYNPPYLYVLALIGKSGQPFLYMIKYCSLIFDFVLAFYVMKLASLRFSDMPRQIAVFCTVLFMPTVLLNSSVWGQSDSIYVAFAVAAVYYGLTNRSRTSVVMFAISFSFKLQAIFILPILGVFAITKRVKWRHLPYFFLTFGGFLLPAVVVGRPVIDVLTVYIGQMKEFASQLQLNFPSIYHVLGENANNVFTYFNSAGVWVAGAAVLSVFFCLWYKRHLLNDQAILTASFIFALMIPFILPQMHDRYFFLAEIFSLFIFIYNKKRWLIPLIVSYASTQCYVGFLIGFPGSTTDIFIEVYLYNVIMLAVILGITVYDSYFLLRKAEANYISPPTQTKPMVETEEEVVYE